MWLLSVEDDQGLTTYTRLDGERYTLGRASDRDVVLAQRNVSRRHASLERRDGEWFFVDEGSANGSFLDGCSVRGAVRFGPDDRIAVGPYRLTLQTLARDSMPAPPPRYVPPARLRVLAGPGAGVEQIVHRNEAVTIGREDDCTLRVVHDDVAGLHVMVCPIAGGHYELLDKSGLGVRVNGRRLRRKVLEGGDAISIGAAVLLRYFEPGQAADPRLETVDAQTHAWLAANAGPWSEAIMRAAPVAAGAPSPYEGLPTDEAPPTGHVLSVGKAWPSGGALLADKARPSGEAPLASGARPADEATPNEGGRPAAGATSAEASGGTASAPRTPAATGAAGDEGAAATGAAGDEGAATGAGAGHVDEALRSRPAQSRRRRVGVAALAISAPLALVVMALASWRTPAGVASVQAPLPAAEARPGSEGGASPLAPSLAAASEPAGAAPDARAEGMVRVARPAERGASKPARAGGEGARALDLSSPEARARARARLEARLRSGQASTTDARALMSLCKGEGDAGCVRRVEELLRRSREQR
ncbi:MAG TPA: FHA domain-containing protein [Polyangiaceae bacterium]|nr:FHA domain-containing protein [Polyangiaceae bacterium]